LEACYRTRNFPVALREEPAVPAVRREIVLPVPRERAWELLTDEAELSEWLADEVELEAEPGAALRAPWDDGEERTGVVEEVEPGRRLRFRWDDDATGVPSRVEWTLHDAPGGGTRVVVVERALVPLALPPLAATWPARFVALARLAARALVPA
jgi:uncharacterized protein YndB with AHSA1/START domain